jgi:hypothetical protein
LLDAPKLVGIGRRDRIAKTAKLAIGCSVTPPPNYRTLVHKSLWHLAETQLLVTTAADRPFVLALHDRCVWDTSGGKDSAEISYP